MYCFGCGDDITCSLSNMLRMSRMSLFACHSNMKKKLSEILKSKDSNIIIGVDELMKVPGVIDGKMCRPCVFHPWKGWINSVLKKKT